MMKRNNPLIKDTSNMSMEELANEISHLSGARAYIKAVGNFPRQPHSEKYLYCTGWDNAHKATRKHWNHKDKKWFCPVEGCES